MMMIHWRQWAFLTTVLAFSGPSLAQEADNASSGEAGETEEIVVTAQRRSERAQKVPIAMTALSSKQLEAGGISSSYDLSAVAPGLNFGRSLGYASPFLRGVGTTNVTGGDEPSVATYVDGVYQGAMYAAALPFNNVERVEVLKGPQGTLFGRNATGGLINIVTRAPSDTFEATAAVSYATFDVVEGDAYITGPLGDRVSASLAVRVREQGRGYVLNRVTGNWIGEEDSRSARLRFDVALGEVTTAELSFDYTKGFATGTSPRVIYPGTIPIGALGGGLYSYGPYEAFNSVDPVFDLETWGAVAKIRTEFSFADFVSTTAFRRSTALNALEADGTSLDNRPSVIHPTLGVQAAPSLSFSSAQSDPYFLTQEFLLSGETDAFTWITGLYYQHSRADYEPLGLYLSLAGAPFATISSKTTTNAAAVFAQGTYRIADGLNVTAGVRYNYEKKKFEGSGTGSFAALRPSDEKDWDAATWRLALDYQAAEGLMLFAVASRGFKSGVFNSNSLTDYQAVDPEELDAYEIGFKYDPSRRLRINGSVYRYHYKNLQLLQMVAAGTSRLTNAAEAEISGLDLEFQAVPIDGLTIRGGLSLIDSEYTDFRNASIFVPAAPAGNALVAMDVTGNQLVRTPEVTVNIGLIYDIDLESGGSLQFAADYFYSSGFPWEPAGRLTQQAYDIFNAQAEWRAPDGRWGVAIFARNIGDEVYGTYVSTSNRVDSIAYAPPRTFGVRLNYEWN